MAEETWGAEWSRAAASAEQLASWMRRSHSFWRGRNESDVGWVFRGNSQPYPLVPSAFRSPTESNRALVEKYTELTGRICSVEDWRAWVAPSELLRNGRDHDDWEQAVANVAVDAMTHARLVANFALLARDVKLYDGALDFAWHLTNRSFDYFWRYFHGTYEHEIFAVAQHHCVPTMLLDWTFNPFASAFFAASQAAKTTRPDRPSRIEIWALRLEYLDRNDARVKRMTVRPGVTPFVDAQEGLFTWCPEAYSLRLERGAYVAQEEIIAADAETFGLEQPLRKMTLEFGPEAQNVQRLLQLLWREHMSAAYLMPSFDNVAEAIRVQAPWLVERAPGDPGLAAKP